MDLLLLGPVEATSERRKIALGPMQQRAVLAMLALEANRPVSADHLIDGLWGESPPASAPKMVQLYISQLRKALAGSAAAIVTRGRAYVLECDREAVDVERAEQLLEAAADASAPNGHARAALALWRGPPLADVADEPFAAPAIRRLEELRLRAQELAIDSDLAVGRHESVLGEAAQLAEEHPLREHAQAQHMLTLYRSGRQAEALEAFRSARARLVEEIGAEPGNELRELHAAMLRQDPALDAPARAPTRPHAPERVRGHPRALMVAAFVLACAAVAVIAVVRSNGTQALSLAEDSVGRIDAGSGALVQAGFKVGRGPSAVAIGAGSVWVANTLDGTVTRIDPGRDRATTIDVGAHPGALAFGAGSLWVASGDDESIARVDPAVNRVIQHIPVGGQASAVAVGYGSVWVAEAREDVVVRVDLSTGRTIQIAASAGPTALATGAGAVWVAAEDSGQLVRIEPRSNRATSTTPVGHGPAAVAVGDGVVWVANPPDGTISRYDPAAEKVAGTLEVGAQTVAIAADAQGLWVADAGAATVVRLDPESGRTERTLEAAVVPAGLAADGGSVWVAAAAARTSHRGGTLAVEGECPDCPLDPGWTHAATTEVITLAYDGLLEYRRVAGSAGETIVPALATSIPEPQDGGRTYVFTLRAGLRYSDGRPVRAADVRESIERAFRLFHDGPVSLLSAIRGGPRCRRAPGRCDLSRGIVSDERARTVTVRLSRPDPTILSKLASPSALVVPAGTPDDTALHAPPGTGPYRIASLDERGNGRLVRNEHFRSWSEAARPAGFADAIVFHRSDQVEARIRPVERGRSDLASLDNGGDRFPVARLAGILTRYASRIHVAPQLGLYYMFMNVREAPFDDVRVRRAVNFATDRARMVELTDGPASAEASCQAVPPSIPGDGPPRCPFTAQPGPAGTWTAPDIATARRLIAESGTRGMDVTVWTDTTKVRYGRYFERLLRQLGYRTRLRVVEVGFPYYEKTGDSRTHAQIGMGGWTVDYPTPASFFDPNFSCKGRIRASTSSFNPSQLCSPPLDRAVTAALAARGPEAERAWTVAERRLAALAPAVPLASHRHVLLTSARAGNVQQNPVLGTLLDRMWVR